MDLEAFYVLSSDIDDEFDFRHEMFRCGEVCHRFDQSLIDAECSPDNIFSIPGHRTSTDTDIGVFPVDTFQN